MASLEEVFTPVKIISCDGMKLAEAIAREGVTGGSAKGGSPGAPRAFAKSR